MLLNFMLCVFYYNKNKQRWRQREFQAEGTLSCRLGVFSREPGGQWVLQAVLKPQLRSPVPTAVLRRVMAPFSPSHHSLPATRYYSQFPNLQSWKPRPRKGDWLVSGCVAGGAIHSSPCPYRPWRQVKSPGQGLSASRWRQDRKPGLSDTKSHILQDPAIWSEYEVMGVTGCRLPFWPFCWEGRRSPCWTWTFPGAVEGGGGWGQKSRNWRSRGDDAKNSDAKARENLVCLPWMCPYPLSGALLRSLFPLCKYSQCGRFQATNVITEYGVERRYLLVCSHIVIQYFPGSGWRSQNLRWSWWQSKPPVIKINSILIQ